MADDKKENPSPPGFIEKMRGKRTKDIRLPNFTGVRDKRLGPGSEVDKIRRSMDVLKGLTNSK